MTTAPTRRERLRTSTAAEIKEHARRLLVEGGVEAVSLRAIARDMGMTAPAIYRYFPSLDALVEAIAGDLYDELRDVVVAARDKAGSDPSHQIQAMARAFRDWSVGAHTRIHADPRQPPAGPDRVRGRVRRRHASRRPFGQPFMEVLAELWQRSGYETPPRSVMEERLAATLEPLRMSHGDVPIEVAWAFLTGWARLYGLVVDGGLPAHAVGGHRAGGAVRAGAELVPAPARSAGKLSHPPGHRVSPPLSSTQCVGCCTGAGGSSRDATAANRTRTTPRPASTPYVRAVFRSFPAIAMIARSDRAADQDRGEPSGQHAPGDPAPRRPRRNRSRARPRPSTAPRWRTGRRPRRPSAAPRSAAARSAARPAEHGSRSCRER